MLNILLNSKILNLESIRFLVEIVLVTFLILLFGEVLPKVYASRNALLFSKLMSKFINFVSILLTPFSIPLIALTKLFNKNYSIFQSQRFFIYSCLKLPIIIISRNKFTAKVLRRSIRVITINYSFNI